MSEKIDNQKFFELVKNDAEALTLLKKLDSPHTPLTVDGGNNRALWGNP